MEKEPAPRRTRALVDEEPADQREGADGAEEKAAELSGHGLTFREVS